ncbi:MAG: SPASM domain-containing protein [Candidatus Neomarinimicrobiota bacterium]
MMVRARCAPQIIRIASQMGSPLVASAGCLAARRYCRITPAGEVTPCPYLPLVGGSVRERPFMEIWQDSWYFRRLRSEIPAGRCGTCDYRESCGGCRARAFALTGELLSEDPWCEYEPPERHRAEVASTPTWTPEADERLQRIPPFIRSRVKVGVERFAELNHESEITPAVITATLEGMGRRIPFRRPKSVGQSQETVEGDGSYADVS